MAAAAAADFAGSKRAMAYALCKHVSLDPNTISSTSIEESDIATLFSHIVKSSEDEVLKWVEFSSNFVGKCGEQHALLGNLNQELSQKSVLLGNGFKPSVADIVVFATVQVFVSHLGENELQKYSHVLRWMDYIQNIVDFGTTVQKVNVTKSVFDPPTHPKKADKGDTDPSSKKVVSGQKNVGKSDANIDSKKAAPEVVHYAIMPIITSTLNDLRENKAPENKANPTPVKKKAQEKSAGKPNEGVADKAPQKTAEKDSECNVSILNIQVGLIRKAWKHPSADSLLVEEIDLGGGNVRQVVSGLAKYFSPEELVVLCASNQDHTVVEPLIPPEGAKLGERISFAGFDGKPEDVLNPKKKQLDKITPVGSESGDNKEKGKGEMKPEEAQEVWKEMLKQFKDEAQRMHTLTLKAYDVYSQRAREVLLEASDKLKIHADKAQKDLSVIATEVGEEGQEYLKLAAQNSPDSIKDISETFSSLGKLKISEYQDYHVGIPFGTFLTVGGFLNFMLTGRTSAIRFGIILGFALLAMGISSLRSQRAGGRRPRLLLKGQAG
uniref:tRNA-binding domain-containing protein n=1 Tax=Oryza punctata TaxID=4537 RepID=A0A0E0JQD6_ORYPU